MKVSQFLTCLVASQVINAASIPEAEHALITLEGHRVVPASEIVSPDHTLERRKGGGGRGGGGGGRSGGGRTTSSGGGGGARGYSGGAGTPRPFGGGQYYGGGARTPYRAGGRTPGGISPGLLIAPVAMLAIMPGLWLYSTYPYHYNNQYRFHNETADADDDDNNNNNNNDKRTLWERQEQGRNETLPVMCVCSEGFPCSCEENEDPEYLDELVGNGSYPALNKTLVTVSDVNGTKTLVVNGTLEEGTVAPEENFAATLRVGNYAGYYAVAMMVLYGVLV